MRHLNIVISAFSVVCFSLSVQAQVVTTQDTTAALAAGGAASIYYGVTQPPQLQAKLEQEIAVIEKEFRSTQSAANQRLNQAKLVESGLPRPQSIEYYTGRFINGPDYYSNSGNPAARNSSEYRLQSKGAKKLAEGIVENQDFKVRGQQVELVIYKADGTHAYSGYAVSERTTQIITKRFKGTPEEVAEFLVNQARGQSTETGRKSIVKVELNYQTFDPPNPEMAARMRAKAKKLHHKAATQKAKVRGDVARVQGVYENRINRIKRFAKPGGVALIVAAVSTGFIRHSLAQGMVTLAEACSSEEMMRMQSIGYAVQSGRDVEDVEYDLWVLCSQ